MYQNNKQTDIRGMHLLITMYRIHLDFKRGSIFKFIG